MSMRISDNTQYQLLYLNLYYFVALEKVLNKSCDVFVSKVLHSNAFLKAIELVSLTYTSHGFRQSFEPLQSVIRRIH